MQSISSLVKALASARIRIGEVELEARALRASETDLIFRLWPRPLAPLKPAPGKGSLSMEPDERDAAYLAARRVWNGTIACVEVAASCGLEADGKAWDPARPEGELRAWGDAATLEMRRTLTVSQIDRAGAAVHGLIDEGKVRDAVIVEVPKDAGAGPGAFKLPERYGIPEAGAFLRICERYGIDPFIACGVPHDDPGMWALLAAQERVRVEEDAQEVTR